MKKVLKFFTPILIIMFLASGCKERCFEVTCKDDIAKKAFTKCKVCPEGICPKGWTLCNEVCINIISDEDNCGSCNNKCPEGSVCVNGKCQCPGGTSLCGGKCVNLENNKQHCGSCGRSCPKGTHCNNGKCEVACPKGTPTLCFNGCRDLKTDANHCGACDNKCPAGKYVSMADVNVHREHPCVVANVWILKRMTETAAVVQGSVEQEPIVKMDDVSMID